MGLLEGKVALVTGGGSGIGRVTCQVLAREGASVAVADWNEESAQETASLLEGEGLPALAIHADVSDEDAVQAMVRRTLERFGALHCASNNAALGAGFHATHALVAAQVGEPQAHLPGVRGGIARCT